MNDTAVMEDPTLGDGDDPPEIEVEFEEEGHPDYPWSTDPDIQLRSFIFQQVADADYALDSQIPLADAWFAWIKDRSLPKPEKKGKHLKPVET